MEAGDPESPRPQRRVPERSYEGEVRARAGLRSALHVAAQRFRLVHRSSERLVLRLLAPEPARKAAKKDGGARSGKEARRPAKAPPDAAPPPAAPRARKAVGEVPVESLVVTKQHEFFARFARGMPRCACAAAAG